MADRNDRLVAKYYRMSDGSVPVRDFIDKLPEATGVLVENAIDRINELCTLTRLDLPLPHSKPLENGIRYLRPQSYRIFYTHSDRMVVLLHMYEKLAPKLKESEIQIARNRLADFHERMAAVPRKPPSALATGKAPKKRATPKNA